jgi:cobaltochelatase CobT
LIETVKSTIQKRDDKGAIRHGAEWLTLWSDPGSLKTPAEKRSEAALRQAHLLNERLLAAAARSVSGDPGLQIAFNPEFTSGGAARRGEIDGYALKQRFHSPAVHRQMAPAEPAARRLFELCEQLRCEALGAARFPGVRDNLIALHLQRLEASNLLNAHLASLIPLAEGLRMTLRDALTEDPEVSVDTAGFRMWDRWIRSRFAGDLAALRRTQMQQDSFAPLSLVFIRRLLTELGSNAGHERQFPPTGNARGPRDDSEDTEGQVPERLLEDASGEVFEPGGSLFLDDDRSAAAVPPDAGPDHAVAPYAIFTTAHDAVMSAVELVSLNSLDRGALREARASLDRRRDAFRRDFARLVLKLQRRLLARQVRNWTFDLEEGLIDASRLDRVVVDAGFASAYKQEQESKFRNSVVSILIDNSGSMRGTPVEIACLASDMISAALERCGIACEILGFTTRGWKGGDSAKDWSQADRPANPGRLNDVLHIVYKAAGEPVRRSRPYISAMLQTSILKENIDGEALLWASRRLLTRPESRKALIVISDGAPVDEATLQYNTDAAILDRHLREVIAEIENSGVIELSAIGVKHPVGQYYRDFIQIDQVSELGVSLVAMIDKLLAG